MPYIFDYILIDCKISIRKGERFEDKSIFKQGLTYVSYHESLHRHINSQLSHQALVAFPETSIYYVLSLNREDKQNKFFLMYDVFLEKPIRKFKKLDLANANWTDDSDAFDIDPDAKFVIYSSGPDIYIKCVNIPEQLIKYLRPRYRKADYKENPAKVIH